VSGQGTPPIPVKLPPVRRVIEAVAGTCGVGEDLRLSGGAAIARDDPWQSEAWGVVADRGRGDAVRPNAVAISYVRYRGQVIDAAPWARITAASPA